MTEREMLAERFEAEREPLRALALRMLGSRAEADDAVQEAWLRLDRVDASELVNLPGWLRTVVTRICLDALRSRRSRREQLSDLDEPASVAVPDRAGTPEDDALLADAVGRAMLVVLDALEPAERIAFVLHDAFAVPFDEISLILGRTPGATKKLASRARRKVEGRPAVSADDLARHRRVVSSFLEAAGTGDLPAILALLSPDVVRHADAAALPPGGLPVLRGAEAVARGTAAPAGRSRQAELALVDGDVGLVLAPGGRLLLALTFTIEDERIAAYEVIAAPERLALLDLALLP